MTTSEPPDQHAGPGLKEAIAAAAARFGPWTAHNLELAPGVFTKGPEPSGEELKVRRVTQLVADLAARPPSRVIDLGALEGLYGLEFALSGAEVMFVEGREASAEKIRFAIDALGVSGATVVCDDVRNLAALGHGEFDVVLCVGILYHLDAPSALRLLHDMRAICGGLLVLDTHVALEDHEIRRHPKESFWVDPAALSPMRSVESGGHSYYGRDFGEHAPGSSPEERRRSAWASLDNESSFWLTKPSLINALVDAGFTSVLECLVPPLPGLPPDRLTLVARAGGRVGLKTSSINADCEYERAPELSAAVAQVADTPSPHGGMRAAAGRHGRRA